MTELSGISIKDTIDYLEKQIKYVDKFDRERIAALIGIIEPNEEKETFKVGSSVDILEEVHQQMDMVKLLRKQIVAQGVGANPKDLQSLVSTTTSLFAMLTKYSNDIVNQDRIKAIESAVVTVIQKLLPEKQEEFFKVLEENLSE